MTQELLANLSSIYYHKLSEALNNPDGFQMATGSTQISDQTKLDIVADPIPPVSLNNSFSGNPVNSYSANYGNILNELVVPSYVDNALGTQYASSWKKYLADNAKDLVFTDTEKLLASTQALMRKWGALKQIPSGTVQAGMTALVQEADNPVTVGVNLWHANSGNSYGFLPPYTDIPIQFNNPRPCSFSITSIQDSADLSHTWAEGKFGIFFDIFEFGNETSYSNESQKFVGNGFTLNFSCRQVSLDVNPIEVGEDFSIADTSYKAWMSKQVLQKAYESPNDATVWTKSADWDKYFGENGSFSRVITKIFLADNISLTMNSTANFSSEEITNIKTAAEGGLWPFFVAEGSGGYSSTVTKNDDNTITIKSSSPQGVYILLGVATASIKELMS